MQTIIISNELLLKNTKIINNADVGGAILLELPGEGGGISVPQMIDARERFLVFTVELMEEHSLPMNFFFYSKMEPDGKPAFNLRFGIMPGIQTLICIDRNWLSASTLFPEHTPGQLKVVCHGRRMEPEEIDRIEFMNYPSHHNIHIRIGEMRLQETRPECYPLPERKLIDEMGQYKSKSWPGKCSSLEELSEKLHRMDQLLPEGYGIPDRSPYGGWTGKKLAGGSGRFSKIKHDNRWWLVDPLGYAFFSMGPDCVGVRSDCRIDGVEGFLDWLPQSEDPEYEGMFGEWKKVLEEENPRRSRLFSFEQANLYRVFGGRWKEQWISLMRRQLMQHGMNSLGNWSDPALFSSMKIPYVTSLPEYPTTGQKIFRDFPDVFSEEYRQNAEKAAEFLAQYREDPYLIGYFLGNEPAWAFVDNLVIADEVLYNPERTCCREELIRFLKHRYETPEALEAAWKHSFESFEELYQPISGASRFSLQAREDMREFSRRMLEAYIAIPSSACRSVDPEHMNLGLRWAWISDPDVVTGWEHFDVFSINCYAVDPTSALNRVQELGVDLPVVIGEFHFGALDRGLTATGLEAVRTQKDRAIAYQYYCEHAAAHSLCVGCHYFQFYDQFALGRFDGENYNIGLFDICSLPHQELLDGVRAASSRVYEIATGKIEPTEEKPASIPMIAY